MNTIKIQIIITICLLSVFASCKKDDIPPIPELTPVGSFSMEFDDFKNNKSASLSFKNWFYSSVNVAFFSIIASANMTIPSLAYAESFKYTPTYIGDMTWQWSYDILSLGATYNAKLNGITQRKSKVKWEMYITKSGSNGFTNFLWFEGTTSDSTAANWTIYHYPQSPVQVLKIEWKLLPVQNESSLKYTNVDSGSEKINSFIDFGIKSDALFDRFYTIFLSDTKTNISIEWNSETKNGRVKNSDYFNNDNWQCWDEFLLDAWCD